MNNPHRGLVALGMLLCCAGCANQLTGPTFEGDSGGGTVTITAVTPPAGTVLESTMFPNVTIEYTLTSTVQEPRVWTCVGRTAATIVLSSCRDTPVASASGTVVNHPGIYWVNKQRAVADTRFVASFLTDGDIVKKRTLYPPLEIEYTQLTDRILAHKTVEHLWYWADLP
ncbi:MAG TPA: hypothetical protein VGJ39_15820 [Vicinamibacterales bacterium]|jgi:hypothetical protein